MKMSRKICANLGMLLLLSGALYFPDAQVLRGKVIDKSGNGIAGASVELVNAVLSTQSGADGSFSISVPISAKPFLIKKRQPAPLLRGKSLYFSVDVPKKVKVSIYTIDGRFLYHVINSKLAPGFYNLNLFKQSLKPNVYALKVQIGTESTQFRLPVLSGVTMYSVMIKNRPANESTGSLQKSLIVMDSLNVSKPGYNAASMPIGSYDDSVTITLEPYKASYHLNPPNQCFNRFFVQGCVEGDPNSACGGKCRVANSCSPPEDPSKSNLPKTFICPRFMLFSTEMLQAALDDARAYGWGTESSPFNYGVVGHDADVGGVDDGPSSCCQCYQIVFEEPEPSSPKFPELPNPKPLIVQSFNTQASGPKGFDVFMGAGGYGAFNSCYKDNDFGSTTKFDEFIYDQYPYQNPNSGGISFLRYPEECLDGWPPTVAAIQSSACQEKIEQMCNQALVNSNPQVTEDTRRSCIETNKVGSLYHQNWNVMVKRVRCPENLTRVTGCRLKEDHLPLPDPTVQTPEDAAANGTFRSGYHTTTMQDCCKPTCAWADHVVDKNLPADGEWNSFYSCDKNGIPITAE